MTTTAEQTSKNKKKALAAGAIAASCVLAGTVAYFTDRVETSATAKAGTVDLALDANWTDVANFNPGDKADLDYQVSNDGNKSVDVRERLVVTSSVALDTAAQAEFEIYKATDVEQDAAGAYVPKADAKPVTDGAKRIVAGDSKSITYVLPEYTLNGTGANAETESGVTDTNHSADYVLVFKGASSNAFQDADVEVSLLAEAKQHRNTNSDTWATVSSESVTFGNGNVNAVPAR